MKRIFKPAPFIFLLHVISINSVTLISVPSVPITLQESPTDSSGWIHVGLLQINPCDSDVEANLIKGEFYCRKAKEMGVHIVLFPEMWSIGYTAFHGQYTDDADDEKQINFEEWQSKAVDAGSEFINYYRRIAKDLEMAIVITYLEKWEGLPRNSASLIDARGNLLMTYAKVHTCDFSLMERNTTPGEGFFVCDLPVGTDTVSVGIMICFDREFPESARILMLEGAEIILTPNACILHDRLINQFQTRAFENAVGLAMANYPVDKGRSCAYSAGGEEIIIADESEGIFIASFDLSEIRAKRRRTIYGNAWRRPLKYRKLISMDHDPIFIRNDALGNRFDREER